MEEKKILGITEEELEQVKEDLDVEDIEDFNLEEKKVIYEIWLLGYTQDYMATDFEHLIDGEYTEETEAKKCFDYFADKDTLMAYLENNNIKITGDTKHIHLMLEMCYQIGPDITECQDIVEEVEIL